MKFIDNEADAMDIVQNVFTAVWEKKKFRLEENHLKSYLFNSTRNACINFLKHSEVIRKFESEVSFSLKLLDINHYTNGEQSLIEKEDLEKIYSAINSLTKTNREILELSRFERLKNHEIAEQLAIPVRTVETRLFRALKQLRMLLSEKHIQIFFSFFFKKNQTC